MRDAILRALGDLESSGERLGELDGLVGDGDLGVTVADGAKASVEALRQLPLDAGLPAMLRAVGAAFGSANPSTFGALIRGALSDAARRLQAEPAETDVSRLQVILTSAVDGIARRGRTQRGDKTVLDAIAVSADAVGDAERIDRDLLDRMADAAEVETERLRDEEFQRGRAAWVGARGAGVADPGSTAYIAFLRALSARVPQ